jgi:TPR repeat protein
MNDFGKLVIVFVLCLSGQSCYSQDEQTEYERVLVGCTPGAKEFKKDNYQAAFEKWWDPLSVFKDEPKERLKSVSICLQVTELANNDIEIAELLKKAGAENNEAQMYIGMLYATGKGLPQDYDKAQEWLEIASTNGNNDAQTLLAEFRKALDGGTTKRKKRDASH